MESSVKLNNTCPKCESTRCWVMKQLGHQQPGSTNDAAPLPVAAFMVPADKKGYFSFSTFVKVGTFEVWVCAQCGFTEWYAVDVNEKFDELAQRGDMDIRLVERDNSRGPFR